MSPRLGTNATRDGAPRPLRAGTARPGVGLLVASALVVLAALVPFTLSEFKVGLVGLGLAYGLFAVGLDLAWGRSGIVSIGQSVFFGLGVYGVAVAIRHHVAPELGGLIGVALATGLGIVIAMAGLRRGTNPSTMAVLTLAITLLAEKVARSWHEVTGGSSGIFVPPQTDTYSYYWICLAVIALILVALWFFVLNRRFGNRLTAIRLNDERAEHLGIPVMLDRVHAFALSAALGAIGGALAAPWMSSVTPDRIGVVLSTQVLVWVALGGKNSILGPMVGATVLTFGQDALASSVGAYYLLVLGLMFVVSVLVMPDGIAGLFRRGERLAETMPAAVSAAAAAPVAAARPAANSARPARRHGEAIPDALACIGLAKKYDGNRVLDGVDLRLKPGEIVCLIGPNGAGKTTLLDVVSGAAPLDGGTVWLNGARVDKQPPHRRIRAGLGRTFQVPSLFPGLTVRDHIMLARQEMAFVAPLPAIYAALLDAHADSVVETLSLSDRRALETAMALCAQPDVLLLDEPAAGLASNEAATLARTLRNVRDELGCAILCVEHDMEIVRALADRVVCLHHGCIISEGSMDEVSADAAVRQAFLGLA